MQKEEYTAEHILELWNERCSIMEFDGGLTRTQAERAAYYDLRKVLGRFVVPVVIKEKLKLTKESSQYGSND